MQGTNQKHVELMNELEEVIEPIIKKHLQENKLTLAEITYYSSRTAEEIALREIRHLKNKK